MRIYYFIPEDGDDVNHPNAFSIPDATPTVAKIKQVRLYVSLWKFKFAIWYTCPLQRFPLQPNAGEYFLFRFKYKIRHAIKFGTNIELVINVHARRTCIRHNWN